MIQFLVAVVAGVLLAFVILSFLHLRTVAFLWGLGLMVPVIVPLVFLANVWLEDKLGVQSRFSHSFFAHSARIYTGKGKGGASLLFLDQIKTISHRTVRFREIEFHLFTIDFKDAVAGWLPNYTVLNFGIPAGTDMHRFYQWMEHHELSIDRTSTSLVTRIN
jgi:hypothetical protein